MKSSIIKIISIIPTILLAVAGYFFADKFNNPVNWGLVIIIVIAIIWIFGIIITTQYEIIKAEKKKSVNYENEIKGLKNYAENPITQSNSKYPVLFGEERMGNNLLLMALTQDSAIPLKIKMLEVAVSKYNNYIATLILANAYEFGIGNGVKKNREKAFKLYLKIHNEDSYGICAWKLGYFYQNNLVKAANKHSEAKRLKIAEGFFIESSKKGFPKAKNSLGKLISDCKLGYSPINNEDTMISLYKEASKLGDNYATINLGNYYLKKYYFEKNSDCLKKAKDLFEKAAEMDNLESFVKLGVIYISLHDKAIVSNGIKMAQNNLEKCISYGDNQFSASAYFLLGYLTKNYFKNINFINKYRLKKLINKDNQTDIVNKCYKRSHDIFSNLEKNGKAIAGDSGRYWILLKKSIEDPGFNRDPLLFQLKEKYTNKKN